MIPCLVVSSVFMIMSILHNEYKSATILTLKYHISIYLVFCAWNFLLEIPAFTHRWLDISAGMSSIMTISIIRYMNSKRGDYTGVVSRFLLVIIIMVSLYHDSIANNIKYVLSSTLVTILSIPVIYAELYAVDTNNNTKALAPPLSMKKKKKK